MNTETIILTSNDDSITLTNHRIIQRNSEVNKEIFLKDIVSNEIVRKKSKYYLTLTIIFILASIFTIYSILESENFEIMPLFYFILILLAISVFQYLTKTDKYLKISGKYNFIEFSIKNLNDSNLNKFRNTLLVESENRKKE
jgi:magnesium-transporting ATPase (P-type)